MRENELFNTTIGEIVASDYRTASVFKEAGIDFCCGGKKTLDQACSEKRIEKQSLAEKLRNVQASSSSPVHRFNEWDPRFLCDYIINVHHTFVKKSLPDLLQYTSKIASVHSANHPELVEVAHLFSRIHNELTQHLKREEEVFFPAVKDFSLTASSEAREIVDNEIRLLSEEHEFAGGAMDRINEITKGYALPADACNTYRVAFGLLEQFEDDLHTHVHLENNVLFPKLINM